MTNPIISTRTRRAMEASLRTAEPWGGRGRAGAKSSAAGGEEDAALARALALSMEPPPAAAAAAAAGAGRGGGAAAAGQQLDEADVRELISFGFERCVCTGVFAVCLEGHERRWAAQGSPALQLSPPATPSIFITKYHRCISVKTGHGALSALDALCGPFVVCCRAAVVQALEASGGNREAAANVLLG
jgi:hypothetical protein